MPPTFDCITVFPDAESVDPVRCVIPVPVGGPTWPTPFTRTRLIDTADDVTSSTTGLSGPFVAPHRNPASPWSYLAAVGWQLDIPTRTLDFECLIITSDFGPRTAISYHSTLHATQFERNRHWRCRNCPSEVFIALALSPTIRTTHIFGLMGNARTFWWC